MKKLLTVGAAAAAFAVAGLGLSGSASAATASASAPHSAAIGKTCLWKLTAKENIRIRSKEKFNATALGLFYKHTTTCSYKWDPKGPKYTYKHGCKGTSRSWDYIRYRTKVDGKTKTISGWVPTPGRCVVARIVWAH